MEKIRIADDERRGHSPDRQRKDGRPEPGETAPKLPERSAESKGQQSRRRTHRSEQKQSPDNPIPHEGIACEDNVQYGRRRNGTRKKAYAHRPYHAPGH